MTPSLFKTFEDAPEEPCGYLINDFPFSLADSLSRGNLQIEIKYSRYTQIARCKAIRVANHGINLI